jgi:hypothetical protein
MNFSSSGEGYDIAQICLNGHEANSSTKHMPQFNKTFCENCGEKTITDCPSCSKPIRGYYWGGSVIGASYDIPNHCLECGKAFPWIERKQAAALELLAEELHMDKEEQEELKRDLRAAATEEPRTQAASLKIKRLLTKVGKDAAGVCRDVLVDVVSETAKKIIWPGK